MNINAHDDDTNIPAEYDDAVSHLPSGADEDATIICCLRTDLDEKGAMEMVIICGSGDMDIDIDLAIKNLGSPELIEEIRNLYAEGLQASDTIL